jgi:hypothetical protein
MSMSGNNGSMMQTPQDATCKGPRYELITSSHISCHIFAFLWQPLNPAKEGFLLKSTGEHSQVTPNHPDGSVLKKIKPEIEGRVQRSI